LCYFAFQTMYYGMKRLLFLLIIITFTSCNDGDIIVTSFDFDEANLQSCAGDIGYLFFKINEGDTESLSFRIGITEQQFKTNNTLVSTFNGAGIFANYRIYDGTVTNSYFCNEVPPTTPNVTIEYLADSGTSTLITTALFDDNDGLETVDSNDEDLEGTGDKDKDGIPNYYDFDDDGDNVPTIDELDTENADGDNDPLTNPLDTDGDTIPDYLDSDDDGDGVLTRDEAEGTLDPTQIGIGIPNYLSNLVVEEDIVEEFREHNYDFDSDIQLILTNLVLINGDEEITRETLNMGTIESILTGNEVKTPAFPDN